MTKKAICVVGNPNCGKTTLFNALTGAKQDVGNWPGVTVEKKTGSYAWRGEEVEITDLPGIYSITPSSAAGEDERVARDYILTGETECVVNIIDASNLERNLYLTAQLIEMRVPMLVVVNMLDVAKQHKIEIRLNELEKALGCPVVGIVASRSSGISELKDRISEFLANPVVPPMKIRFDERITTCIDKLEAELKAGGVARPRWFALQVMESAPGIEEKLPDGMFERAKSIMEPVSADFDGDLDIAIAGARYEFVGAIAADAVVRKGKPGETLTDRIDRIVLNRWVGLPIFLFVMYLMFLFTQNLGAAFIDFFDILVGGVLVDGFGALLETLGAPDWLRVMLANGIGGGIQTVATFIPVVFFLFFFLAILEDSGYMARAAFVMDRLMRALGLPGKAFVPLLVGFGCNVPAIMATRTLSSDRDRKMTILLTPFMSCSAKLPIYALFTTAFFPRQWRAVVMIGLYITGILCGILYAILLKFTKYKGEPVPFVMELPNYRFPSARSVCQLIWEKARDFLQKAFTIIFVATVLIWFLQTFDMRLNVAASADKSLLAAIGSFIAPLFRPLGFGDWRVSTALITGFTAKESVVSTLTVLLGGDTAALTTLFTPFTAIVFLVFTLLYTPCVAAIAAVKRELGGARAAAGVVLMQCGIAWIVAFVVHCVGTVFGLV